MPETEIIIYQEADGSAPLIGWLDGLPSKVQDQCVDRVKRLAECGFDLRRPLCDILGQGIYELRAKRQNVNYRILYGFVGKSIILLSHGCSKKKKVPPREIKRAVRNIENYSRDPKGHTYAEGL